MEVIPESLTKPSKNAPILLIAISTLFSVLISILSISNGFFIIFQNFFYVPIIIACIFYTKRGFVFSLLISLFYFTLILMYTSDEAIIFGAFIRVLIFIIIAGVISRLSLIQRDTERGLIDAEHKLKQIIDFLPDPTFVIDSRGYVIEWNRAIEQMTGVPKEDMIGKGDYAYAEQYYGNRTPLLIDSILTDGTILNPRYTNVKTVDNAVSAEAHVESTNEGEGVDIWCTALPFHDTEGKLLGAIESIRDITDLKENEKKLTAALEEKTVMIQEIQHRVMNNLQVISGMIRLQGKWSEDENLKFELNKLNTRIYTLAGIYEIFYPSNGMNLSQINVRNIISTLISDLIASEIVSSKIRFDIDVFNESVDLNRAFSISIVANELISYIAGHFVNERDDNSIHISMKRNADGEVDFIMSGEVEEFGEIKIDDPDIRLASFIIERDLKGKIEADNKGGMTFFVRFNM